MFTYQSNYPSYHGGGDSAYPQQYGQFTPNSGPPPPPGMGMGIQSAYNVNQYGFTQGMGHLGAVPGFTVPGVQQCATLNQNAGYQAPMSIQAPVTSHLNMMNADLYQQQIKMQQMMLQTLEEEIKTGKKQRKQEKEHEEEDDKPSVAKPAELSEVEVKAKVREQMYQAFVSELIRREKVSGTFEMMEGTVKPFEIYTDNDPVALWNKKERGRDVTKSKWDKEADCEYLRAAMKGLGTDDDAIIEVVGTRCNAQRQELKKYFKVLYGRDLIQDLKSELSGDYKELVMALFAPPAEFDAWCIKEAIYGLGTDEMALIEILMTRTNAQIKEIRSVYSSVLNEHYHGREPVLEKDIREDTSGDFKRLLISAVQGERYEIPVERLEAAVEEIINPEAKEGTGMFQVNYNKLCDLEQAKREAQQLNNAGEKRWGTDEETFNRIFSTRDYYQLRATWNEYVKITQRDILNSIDRETSGDFRNGLRAIVMNIRCHPMFFAERLQAAMKGLGTDERTLIRVIVSRSEIDMVQIKECFLKLTGKTLWRWLKEDTSFNFKKLLQKIVGCD